MEIQSLCQEAAKLKTGKAALKVKSKLYPRLDPFSLDASGSKRVNEEIGKFLKERGYMIGNNQEDEYP